MMTPRERATLALEVIDRHHTATGAGPWVNAATLDAAYRELGAAMNAEYGALPDERIVWHLTHDDNDLDWRHDPEFYTGGTL